MDVEGELYRCVVAKNRYTTDTLELVLELGGKVALARTELDDSALLKRPLDFNNEVSYLVVGQIELAFEGL